MDRLSVDEARTLFDQRARTCYLGDGGTTLIVELSAVSVGGYRVRHDPHPAPHARDEKFVDRYGWGGAQGSGEKEQRSGFLHQSGDGDTYFCDTDGCRLRGAAIEVLGLRAALDPECPECRGPLTRVRDE